MEMKSSETWIAKMAEERYPVEVASVYDETSGEDVVFDRCEKIRAIYSAGAKDMKEHLGGFAEWLVRTEATCSRIDFEWVIKDEPHTTDQLIEIYFEQLNS